MLPSGYTRMVGLSGGTNIYIDLGIVTKNTMSAQIAFAETKSDAGTYVFGARNSNSNTSAGQFGFYLGTSGSADYFCWGSARVSQTMPTLSMSYFNFSNELNEGVLSANGMYVSEFSGSSSVTFTGTRNMHLFGFNNAGTHTGGGVTIFGFKLWDNGTLVKDLVPAYEDATSTAGMYDMVSGTLLVPVYNTFNTGVEINGTSDGGGQVKFKTNDFEYVDKIRSLTNVYSYVTAVAQAEEGYVFKHWEVNGNVVSEDEEYVFNPDSATTLKAVFEKITDQVQDNDFKAIALPYNEMLGTDTRKNAMYLDVLDYSINEDAMQKSVSTIVCKSIPSALKINVPIFLFDPKGKIIYYGAIQSIDGDVLTCREPLYLYDDDVMIFTSYYNAHYNVLKFMNSLANIATDKTTEIYEVWPEKKVMPVDPYTLQTTAMLPITENTIANGEDTFLNLFLNYGVLPKYSFYKHQNTSTVTWRLGLEPFNPKEYGRIVLGNNQENIRNISITTQEADATILQIFDSTGSTLRATYGIRYDGVISQSAGDSSFVYRDVYKRKIVKSDDNLRSLAKENLTNSLYQHKIEFDVDLNKLVRFDDLKLGRDVTFYFNDKVFDSILTARSFNKDSDTIHVVLGIVRNNLTSKLNLKKL